MISRHWQTLRSSAYLILSAMAETLLPEGELDFHDSRLGSLWNRLSTDRQLAIVLSEDFRRHYPRRARGNPPVWLAGFFLGIFWLAAEMALQGTAGRNLASLAFPVLVSTISLYQGYSQRHRFRRAGDALERLMTTP